MRLRFALPSMRLLRVSALIVSAACASAAPASASIEAAPFDSELSITRIEATVRPDLEHNSVRIQATTRLRNSSRAAVASVRFTLGNPDQAPGMGVAIEQATLVRASRSAPLIVVCEPVAPGSRREAYTLAFAEPLAPGDEVLVRWDYVLRGEPGQQTPPVPTSADGSRELYLVQEFAWLPAPLAGARPGESPQLQRPEWTLRVEVPAGLHVVADGVRRRRAEAEGRVVEEWSSLVGGWPQLLVGRYEIVRTAAEGFAIEWSLPADPELRRAVGLLAPKGLAALRQLVAMYGDPGASTYHVVASHARLGAHALFMGQVIERASLRDLDLQTLAHEMAHTWWGPGVAPHGEGGNLLSEGLAELSAGWVMRGVEGEPAWRAMRRRWKIRAFCPYPASNERPGAAALVEQPGQQAAELRQASEARAPLVLDAVRAELGDERFFAALRRLLDGRRGRGVTVAGLIEAWNREAGTDRSAIWRAWLDQPGHPSYVVDSFSSAVRDAKTVSVTIANRGSLTAPVPLLLRSAAAEQRHLLQVPAGERRTYRFAVPGRVKAALVDPDLDAFTYAPAQAVPLWLSLDPAGLGGDGWGWFNASWARFQAGRPREAAELLSRHFAETLAAREIAGLEALGRDPREACYLLWRARYWLAAGEQLRAGVDAAAAMPGFAGLLRDPRLLSAARHSGLISAAAGEAQVAGWLAALTGRPLELPEAATASARSAAVAAWITWWDGEGRTRPVALEVLTQKLPAPRVSRRSRR